MQSKEKFAQRLLVFLFVSSFYVIIYYLFIFSKEGIIKQAKT